MRSLDSFLWDRRLPDIPSLGCDVSSATSGEFSEALKSLRESMKRYCQALKAARQRRDDSIAWLRNEAFTELGLGGADLRSNAISLTPEMKAAWDEACLGLRMDSVRDFRTAIDRLSAISIPDGKPSEAVYCPFAIKGSDGTVWIPSACGRPWRTLTWTTYSSGGSEIASISYSFQTFLWTRSSGGSVKSADSLDMLTSLEAGDE